MILLLIQSAILLICSGRVYHPRYLFFMILNLLYTIGAFMFLYKKNPELLNIRGTKKGDAKKWDQYLLAAHHLLLIIILPIVIGFDYRINGCYLNQYYLIPGYLLYALSNFLVLSAMAVNRHFETNVRIQNDRAHNTVTKFPYNFVRHPAYLGSILWALGIPMILGSLMGFIPAGIAIILMVIRTGLEDKLLIKELQGYSDYSNKIKYRLLPILY